MGKRIKIKPFLAKKGKIKPFLPFSQKFSQTLGKKWGFGR